MLLSAVKFSDCFHHPFSLHKRYFYAHKISCLVVLHKEKNAQSDDVTLSVLMLFYTRKRTRNLIMSRYICLVVLHKEKNAQSDDVTLSVYRRSIRNCPWSVELWVGLLRTLEMVGTSHEQIRGRFRVFHVVLGLLNPSSSTD